MCDIIIINRGEKDIDSPRQFKEHFGFDAPIAEGYKEVTPDSCLCQVDIHKALRSNNIPFYYDAGELRYYIGDLDKLGYNENLSQRVGFVNRHTNGLPTERCIMTIIINDNDGEHIHLCEWHHYEKTKYPEGHKSKGYLGTAKCINSAMAFHAWEENDSEFVFYSIIKKLMKFESYKSNTIVANDKFDLKVPNEFMPNVAKKLQEKIQESYNKIHADLEVFIEQHIRAVGIKGKLTKEKLKKHDIVLNVSKDYLNGVFTYWVTQKGINISPPFVFKL